MDRISVHGKVTRILQEGRVMEKDCGCIREEGMVQGEDQ